MITFRSLYMQFSLLLPLSVNDQQSVFISSFLIIQGGEVMMEWDMDATRITMMSLATI